MLRYIFFPSHRVSQKANVVEVSVNPYFSSQKLIVTKISSISSGQTNKCSSSIVLPHITISSED
jgi:hypothetical protein